jgi:hypothetical protein
MKGANRNAPTVGPVLGAEFLGRKNIPGGLLVEAPRNSERRPFKALHLSIACQPIPLFFVEDDQSLSSVDSGERSEPALGFCAVSKAREKSP